MNDAEGRPLPGAPLAAYIDGILDGRVGNAYGLLAANQTLSRAGAGPFRCDIQGGRFSLLPVDTRVEGGTFDDAAQGRFLDALQALLAHAVPGSVEANLRCRLVFADEVAETLFVVRGERIEPLTRRRPRTPADAADPLSKPRHVAAAFGLHRREVLWAAPLLLLVGALFAWQSGWIDRVLAARAESLAIDTGPFDALLAVKVERAWGNYEVTLSRGADYPATPSALAERLATMTDLAHRTAGNIVGDGRDLFVQVLDAEQKVLAETKVDVRPLLTAAEATVKGKLPGLIGANALRLSIVAAPGPK